MSAVAAPTVRSSAPASGAKSFRTRAGDRQNRLPFKRGAAGSSPRSKSQATSGGEKKPDPIVFQQWFKSVGPRTYAAQMKQAKNGNYYLVLTEGKRDPKTNELIKHSLYLFSEDFRAFLDLMRATAQWITDNPLPAEVKAKRDAHWKKIAEENAKSGSLVASQIIPGKLYSANPSAASSAAASASKSALPAASLVTAASSSVPARAPVPRRPA
jgi:hypothetical protein